MTGAFETLLIANRGEIACRIIRSAHRMGLRTVAVFSEADRHALHVSMADEAALIGPAPASESYLDGIRIVEAAKRTGAGAVHPGYGFLSENAGFAEACADAGLVFVGPPPAAIRAMGSKSAAKALMAASSVPLVPGYHDAAQDDPTLLEAARRIGFPVLIKATAGGGGKGMRIVAAEGEFAASLSAARREAKAAVGDDTMLIEKYIERPRHIEVQVFGDTFGNVVSLFERECTLQRRHQKVIEEAPAARLTDDEREAISAAARTAAAAVGYVGAGTVEFVANADGFYFIEMNTRLQVEHPVTEMITGLDLVEWQIRVARGEPLPLSQDAIGRRGHAVEARIYAEDPERGFLPSIGPISVWRQPEAGEGLRIDTGFRAGDTVTPYYDPMLAKLIVHGADRAAAFSRLAAALDGFQIAGVSTNLGFLRALATHPAVVAGDMDTGLIERDLVRLAGGAAFADRRDLAAAVAAVLARETRPGAASADPWERGDGFMIAGRRRRRMVFAMDARTVEAVLIYGRSGLVLSADEVELSFSWTARPDGRLDVFVGDGKETVSAAWSADDLELVTARGRFRLHHVDPFRGEAGLPGSTGHLRAPMPGSIRQIFVTQGQQVAEGMPVLVMEAMKMEHVLRVPAAGRLASLHCAVGDFVQEGTELAVIEPSEATAG